MKITLRLLLLLIAMVHTSNIMPAQEANKPHKRSACEAELESHNVKRQKVEEEEQEEKEEEEECAICLQPLHVAGKSITTLNCHARNPQALNHTFHTACIDQWLRRNPKCPVCRTAVPQNEIEAIRNEQLIKSAYSENDEANQQYVAELLHYTNSPDSDVQRVAQLRLGNIYRLGAPGVPQDFAQARIFYNQANKPNALMWVRRGAQRGLQQIELQQ